MFSSLLNLLDRLSPPAPIYAHCDIPCGIYDPHAAQVAAHTIIRMNQMLSDLDEKDDKKADHQIVRLTKVKEDHADIVKNEIRILWGDYFKPEHLEKYPDLHSLVFETLKLASKARQEINVDASEKLLENVQKIATIFFETKGRESGKVKSVYPTERELVEVK